MIRQPLSTQTLELVAVALSEEYGVRVVCEGRRATTSRTPGSKPVITIPSVSLQDENYLALLRGYIDHEVGHVRYTDEELLDRELVKNPGIIGSLKLVCSIYDDVHVERLMGESYPGCSRNLRRLTALVYVRNAPKPVPAADLLRRIGEGSVDPHDVPYALWAAVSQYILYRIRTDTLPDVGTRLPEFREPVDLLAPGLVRRLEPVLSRVQAEAVNTETALNLARETLAVITDFFWNDAACSPGEGVRIPADYLKDLAWVLRNGGTERESVDIGLSAALLVDDLLQDVDETQLDRSITIRHEYGGEVWKERLLVLTDEEQKEALQASAKMDAQLQALLQSYVLNRTGSAKTGRLNTNSLHRLHTCNTNIFYKNVRKRKINTEIVLAVDMSGSMRFDDKAIMASKALYAVAYSLMQVKGLVFSIIGFFNNNVVDILCKGGRLSPRMRITPDGGTLCGNALRYAMQTFSGSVDARKIVMMLTDGDANDPDDFEETIRRAKSVGIEFLGVGITDEHILKYLPEEECCVINDLRKFAAEVLRMLQKSLAMPA